jgi:PiT family inorganic phosphate transporter
MVALGSNHAAASTALQAALLAVGLWATAAWLFGIPTSESHALLAGLTGSAFALHGGFQGVNPSAWARILLGLFLSTLCGWIAGRTFASHSANLTFSPHAIKRGQLLCSFSSAFLHGAQDGQKFIAVLLLLRALSTGGHVHQFFVPFPLALLCAGVMALGVLCGGQRIINTVGGGLSHLRPIQGLAADLAGVFCLLLASVAGLPVSTTHTRVSSILGAGSLSGAKGHKGKSLRIFLVWLITFPGCGFLSFFLASLMLP